MPLKVSSNTANATDGASFYPDSPKIGILGHLPASLQPREPSEDPFCIPTATQCVTGAGLSLNMNLSTKGNTKKILCDSTIFAVSTLLRCNLPHFCLFLTDPKYHLGISNNSTFQELQFEHKRSLLAQFDQ